MPDGEGQEPDALEGRVPRIDWLLRPKRIVLVTVLTLFVIGPATGFALAQRVTDFRSAAFAAVVTTGIVLAAPAAAWAMFGLRRMFRARRHRRAAAASAPWRHHGYRSPAGERRFAALKPSLTIAAVRRVLEATGWLALLAGSVLYVSRSATACPTTAAAVTSLVVVAALGMRGYANVGVQWREQPARTGEAAHFSVSVAPVPRGRFERIELTLRCVVERPRRWGLRRPDVVCRFSASRLFTDELVDGAVTLHARFDVPAGLPAAEPYGEPGVFWELGISAERPGARLDETFLVPVYPPLS